MIQPEDLASLMAEFGKAYTRKICGEMERAGTTPARARLLMTLQCHGSCKMVDLSAHLSVTPRSVTKLVDGLESEGLLVRLPHPEDRRITMIRLTTEGRRFAKKAPWPTTPPSPQSMSTSQAPIANISFAFSRSCEI